MNITILLKSQNCEIRKIIASREIFESFIRKKYLDSNVFETFSMADLPNPIDLESPATQL